MSKAKGKTLVRILAEELKEWPEGVEVLTQSRVDGELYNDRGDTATCLVPAIFLTMHQEKVVYPQVTRSQWEAERAKLSKPKANAQGWVRNRGRKNPFDVCTLVDARLRSGEVVTGKFSENLHWVHTGNNFDVMAYRVNELVEDADPEVTAAIDPVVAQNVDAFNTRAEMPAAKYFDGPLQWRDRITEIDRTVEALEEERVSLVQRLAGEGLQLLREFAVKALESAESLYVSDPNKPV